MINVAEILEKFPKGTKLWSNVHGVCELIAASEDEEKAIIVEYFRISEGEKRIATFSKFGEYQPHSGLCNIFPSYWMQDWKKITWKKGDVLWQDGYYCIFEKFAGDNFCSFKARYITYEGAKDTQTTANWIKETNEDVINKYIHSIEVEYGGKLNLETLEIEKKETFFKDGDIVYVETIDNYKNIAILQKFLTGDRPAVYANLFLDEKDVKLADNSDGYNILCEWKEVRIMRFANSSEEQQLFEALAKEGKTWDAEKKEVVDLPNNECEFKPFDKVLVRMKQNKVWRLAFFIKKTKNTVGNPYPYHALNIEDNASDLYAYCIPYNEETAPLRGTSTDWKGGDV